MRLFQIVGTVTLAGHALLFVTPFASGDELTAPSEYAVERAKANASALLAAEEEVWGPAGRIAWGPRGVETVFRALWSDAALAVRFDATDPDPWYTWTRRDDRLWEEEVVEIFVEPAGSPGQYIEVEINPGNVVCDLRLDFAKKKSDLSWDLAGLESRVHVRRDTAGHTTGWTAVALLPWDGFRSATSAALPPRPGDRWRFNVFRIKRSGGKEDPERGALYLAWSPTGKRTFHVPEAFRGLLFHAERARGRDSRREGPPRSGRKPK